jgi:hypothetical protein
MDRLGRLTPAVEFFGGMWIIPQLSHKDRNEIADSRDRRAIHDCHLFLMICYTYSISQARTLRGEYCATTLKTEVCPTQFR